MRVSISSSETTIDDNFKLYLDDDEVNDFPVFIEKLITTNDGNFPVIMDFLLLNNFASEEDLREIYQNIGYTIVSGDEIVNNSFARWKLLRNLAYLKIHRCDLNLELLNFLRSLTFGGKAIKHGNFDSNVKVIRLLLPFCTDFFHSDTYWRKIRYFCFDTVEVIDAIRFLIVNYGREQNLKFLPPPHHRDAFSLKHLSRNKTREVMFSNSFNSDKNYDDVVPYNELCEISLPAVIFKYLHFIED